MNESYIYIAVAFVAGFVLAWIIRSISVSNSVKKEKEAKSLLDNEKMIKETQRKENLAIQRHQQTIELDLRRQLEAAKAELQMMDQNIILLQKSNEETESLLKANQPEIHALKLKLLEAQNNVARYKSKAGEK